MTKKLFPVRDLRNSDDALVERLIKLADSGPEIPSNGPALVKAAIRPAWQSEVDQRRRHRRMAWAAGLTVAASVIVAVTIGFRSGPSTLLTSTPVATLARVVGTAILVAPDGTTSTLAGDRVGIDIMQGSVLRTDTATRAAIELAGGQSVRLDVATALTLESSTTLSLETGAVYVDSGSDGMTGLEILTAFGTATDIGTQFEVRSTSGELVIRVREGTVRLDREGQESLNVPTGFEAEISQGGPVATRVIKANDPEWAWAHEVAPSFELEGQTVMAVLDWVSRETGLWIRFDDDATELIASTTRLHGSADGLSPMEAPAVILASCGLVSRFESDSLVVERAAPTKSE